MPELLWECEVEGRNVQSVHLSGDRIALGYLDDQGSPGSPGPLALVAFDLDGDERWRREEVRGACAIRGGFLVLSEGPGEPSLLDRDGRRVGGVQDGGPVECGGVRLVEKRGDHVELRTETELLVVDQDLRLVDRLPLPSSPKAAWAPFLGDGFVWVEGSEVLRSDRAGQRRVLGPVPAALAEEVMQRFERATGLPALGNMLKIEPSDDWSKVVDAIRTGSGTPVRVGERFGGADCWLVNADRDEGLVFLARFLAPHVVVCLDLDDGLPRWAVYLCGSCCGGAPQPLANGLYVASSGCGGILSWLGPDGDVLFRSEPNEGFGLATAYDDKVTVFGGSRCLVDGGPGLVAHGPRGERLWTLGGGCSKFACDEERQLLAVATWGAQPTPMHVSLRCFRGLDE